MDLTVNQWLGEFDPHTRSQLKNTMPNSQMAQADEYCVS